MIPLSIKAVEGDPFADAIAGVKRGDIVTVTVTSIEDGGIEVEYDGMKSFIRRVGSQPRPVRAAPRALHPRRPYRRPRGVDRLEVAQARPSSIKAREIAEEKEAVEQYGSSDLVPRWVTSSVRR